MGPAYRDWSGGRILDTWYETRLKVDRGFGYSSASSTYTNATVFLVYAKAFRICSQ